MPSVFLLRDTSLRGVRSDDGRRLELLAMGLRPYRGTPWGVDAIIVSALHTDGADWAGAADEDGEAI